MFYNEILIAVLLVFISIVVIKRTKGQRSRKIPVFEWPFDKKAMVYNGDVEVQGLFITSQGLKDNLKLQSERLITIKNIAKTKRAF